MAAALAGATDSADRVGLTLPGPGSAAGGCCVTPEPALVRLGAGAPGAGVALAADGASADGCCGS